MAKVERAEGPQVPAVAPPEYYPPAYYYEDEIDLREYVDVLFRYKWLVVALPLLAVLAAGVMGFAVMTPTYQATALVAITNPRYIVQLSPNFETVPLNQRQLPLRSYPALATSGDLLQRVLPQVSDHLPEHSRSLSSLRGMVSAKSGADNSIIELTVTSTDPEVAAVVANAWADEFTHLVQTVYGQSAEEVAQFEVQLAQAEGRRVAAESEVIAFQARNPGPALRAQIDDRTQALTSYYGSKRAIQSIVQDATGLRQRLAVQPAGSRSAFSDDLSALLLQVASLSGAPGSTAAMPLQLQIQGDASLSDKTVAEQMALLDDLVAALNEKNADLDALIATVQPDLLALQEQLEQASTEETRLAEERAIARELYRSLNLKLEEARIAAQTNGREVQVAARALPPASPSGPRKMMMVGVAGALGLMLGVFGAFAVNFMRAEPRKR